MRNHHNCSNRPISVAGLSNSVQNNQTVALLSLEGIKKFDGMSYKIGFLSEKATKLAIFDPYKKKKKKKERGFNLILKEAIAVNVRFIVEIVL